VVVRGADNCDIGVPGGPRQREIRPKFGFTHMPQTKRELTKKKDSIYKDMKNAAGDLNFEKAAKLRDELRRLELYELENF